MRITLTLKLNGKTITKTYWFLGLFPIASIEHYVG